jgi:phosphatidate cytidylyltransferase
VPSTNLVTRVATAAVGIPLVLVIDRVGGLVFALAVGAVAALSGFELCRMLRGAGYRPLTIVVLVTSFAAAAAPEYVGTRSQAVWVGILVTVLFVCAALEMVAPRRETVGLAWLLTVSCVVYVGVLFGHLTLLRSVHDGAWWILAVFVVTWAYDTGAYFAGTLFGRHPFMRHISPSKTVEGVVGGLCLSTLVSLVAVPTIGLAPSTSLGLGLALGATGQLGDLAESMVKRQVGVKDSGAIVPGHGGLLDRVDSLLFTGAVAYYAAALLGYAS